MNFDKFSFLENMNLRFLKIEHYDKRISLHYGRQIGDLYCEQHVKDDQDLLCKNYYSNHPCDTLVIENNPNYSCNSPNKITFVKGKGIVRVETPNGSMSLIDSF